MATETINVSLPAELKKSIAARVRAGSYGNASEVVCAGLRALAREEIGSSFAQFSKIVSTLPAEPITPEIEQEIERHLRAGREKRRNRRRG